VHGGGEAQAARDRAPPLELVDDVHDVVLPIGARDPEDDRRPAPESKSTLLLQLSREDERTALHVEVTAFHLLDAVDVDLERPRDLGWEV